VLLSLKTLNESLLEVKDSVASIEILANDGDPCLSNGDWPVADAEKARVEKLESIVEVLLVRIFSSPAVISTVWDDRLLDRLTEVFDERKLQSILESTSADKPQVDSEEPEEREEEDNGEEMNAEQEAGGPEEDAGEAESGGKGQQSSRRQPEQSNQKEENGDENEDEDEWSDENDVGFVWMSVTEDEFYQLQEEAMAEQQQKALKREADEAEAAREGEGGEDFGDGYEEDMAAMAEMQGYKRNEGTDAKAVVALPVLDEPPSPDPKEGAGNAAAHAKKDAGESEDPRDGNAEKEKTDPKARGLIESDPAALAALYVAESAKYVQLNLPVYHQPRRTGFEESKEFKAPRGTIIAGRYQVLQFLGEAAFSTALKCLELRTGRQVCVKVIKNSKDFFDQSLDEIQLLKYINSRIPEEYRYGNSNRADADEPSTDAAGGGEGGGASDNGSTSTALVKSNKAGEGGAGAGAGHVLQLYDYFYFKEHLFIVGELLRDNLYEFSRYNRESGDDMYFTLPRLQRVCTQVLTALTVLHSLYCTHCTALTILHSLYCTHSTALTILHSLYCTHCTALTVLHSLYCTHYTALTILHSLYCTHCTALTILHTDPALTILHSLYCTHCTALTILHTDPASAPLCALAGDHPLRP
jgi:hypothetical protein